MERKLQIPETIDRIELFGNLDSNLEQIREATGVDIFQRDDGLVLKGENLDLAEGILAELAQVLQKKEPLDKQKVSYIIGLKKEGLSYNDSNVSRDVICFTHKGKPLKPKTVGQKNYVNSIRNKDIVFGVGPAGTGKTYIAVAMAIKNQLGLVCDPVAGLVEVPCIKRNAGGVMCAITAADMALAGIRSVIPVDEVISAMREVGESLPCALRETAQGGLAATPTGVALAEKIFG